MLFLLFEIGSDRYCLEASRVVEVTPMVSFKKIAQAPPYVAGLISYRGAVLPVIDLSALLGGAPSRPLFSTRIILVEFRAADGERHILGLLAEKVTETISRREEDFQPPGIAVDGTPFLDKVVFDGHGMIQRVETERVLPERVRKYLFAPPAEPE
jgi:chemotaxis-related protein WspB